MAKIKKLTVFMLVLVLAFGVSATTWASEDGIGFSQTIGYSYATLNTGPFTGSLSIASIGQETYDGPHARLGLSLPACCGDNIYTGGDVRFNFDSETMGFDNLGLFAGYQFSIDPVILKFEFGPRVNQDTVFYNLHSYEWGLTFRLLVNPIETLSMYACNEGDPCAFRDDSG